MEIGDENYHIAKWYFYPNSEEIDMKCTHSTEITDVTRNSNVLYDRSNCMEKINLSNGIYN